MKTKGTFAIIQLTRMGDLVQTIQAGRELKESYPEINLKIIARKSFGSALGFLLEKVYDEIILIDKKTLITDNLENSLQNINSFIQEPRLQNIDVLINLSFCETSNYLSSILEPKHRLGTFINKWNQVEVKDQWSQLIYSMVMGGPACPFNLVDIYKSILGVTSRKVWDKQERNNGNPFTLGLHPFASSNKKKWKIKKWSEVIYKVLKSSPKIKILIFGSENERQEVEEILNLPSLKRFEHQIENWVGKLTLEKTFYKIKECSHFVGHDSLLGHLAKEANVPSITVSLGTVRPIETAPYGINTFVVSPKTKCFPCFPNTECNFFQCHADISYQAIAEIVKGFVLEDDINVTKLKNEVSPFHLDAIKIQRYGPTESGWYASQDLDKDSSNIKEVFRDISRVALLYKMEGIEENISFPVLNESIASSLGHNAKGVEQLYQLAEFGKKYSHDVIKEIAKTSPSMTEIKRLGDKIEEVDRLMDLMVKAYPILNPIISFYKVIKSNLKGNNIVEISESSHNVYQDNGILCSIIYELISSTLNNFDKNNKGQKKNQEGSL